MKRDRSDYNEYRALWRRQTGRTKTSDIYRGKPVAKIGTRSCYNTCRKRPNGAHPECKQAHNEYQMNWAWNRRQMKGAV